MSLGSSKALHQHQVSSQLLGHAIAHEMGHLLLSLAGHNPKGIMIGGWSLRELEQAAEGELLFTAGRAPGDRQL